MIVPTQQTPAARSVAGGTARPGQSRRLARPDPGASDPLNNRQETPKQRLVGRHVQLTPIALRHYDLLYEWASHEEIPWQWHGRPVSPEGLRETMWIDCLFHYIVETRLTPHPIGLVTAYGANFHHQTCYMQAGLVSGYRTRGWPFAAVTLALSVIFGRYNLRRVYAQVTSNTFEQFASGEGVWFETEGHLHENVYVNGQFLDTLILTMTRDRWEARIRPLVERSLTARATDDGNGEGARP
jgi:RimJ/RimL family protein N-acetyltransferase